MTDGRQACAFMTMPEIIRPILTDSTVMATKRTRCSPQHTWGDRHVEDLPRAAQLADTANRLDTTRRLAAGPGLGPGPSRLELLDRRGAAGFLVPPTQDPHGSRGSLCAAGAHRDLGKSRRRPDNDDTFRSRGPVRQP